MKFFGHKLEGFGAAIAILSAILVVSSAALVVCFGLCGLTLAASGNGGGSSAANSWGASIMVAALVSLGLIVLSLLAIGGVAIAWGITVGIRRPKQNLEGILDPNRDGGSDDTPR